MILIDTSIWIDHLQNRNLLVEDLLRRKCVVCHPLVVGELAIGRLRDRKVVIESLMDLPQAIVAMNSEILRFIEIHALFGIGIGYIDAGLLASVKLTPNGSLWTLDKRLQAAAEKLLITARPVN